MAGKKRTRKATASKASKKQEPAAEAAAEEALLPTEEHDTTTTAPPTAVESDLPYSSPLWALVQELHHLAMDPDRCQWTIRALADGTSPVLALIGGGDSSSTSSKKKKKGGRAAQEVTTVGENDGGYLILLATHVLNRLVANNEQQQQNGTAAQVVSLVSYLLARILLAVPTPGTSSSSAAVAASPAISSSPLSPASGGNHGDRALLKILERACTGSNQARSFIGRAVLSITVGCTWALDQLVAAEGDDDIEPLTLACWVPATLGLDLMVRLSHNCPKSQWSPSLATVSTPQSPGTHDGGPPTSLQFWNDSQRVLEARALSLVEHFSPELQTVCEGLSQACNMTELEAPCLAALFTLRQSDDNSSDKPAAMEPEAAAAAAKPTSKRSAGRKTRKTKSRTTAASSQESEATPDLSANNKHQAIAKAFTPLLAFSLPSSSGSQINTLRIDGRITVRRWASMALVWFLQGQRRLLDCVHGMLANREIWEAQFWDENDPIIYAENETGTDQGEERRKKARTTETSRSDRTNLPGNVAIVAMASRLIGLVSESNSHCGTRAPTGGLDLYVRAIAAETVTEGLATASATASSGATSKGRHQKAKSPKCTRLDLRSVAVVVLHHLLQAHEDCLEANRHLYNQCHLQDETGDVWLVNDNYPWKERANVEDGTALGYFPVVHLIVEALCRTAASSSTASATGLAGASSAASSFAEEVLLSNRLLKIASSMVLKNIIHDDAFASDAAGDSVDRTRERRPMDAQLVHFALVHLTDSLKELDSLGGIVSLHYSSSNQPDAMPVLGIETDDTIAHYGLRDPLPIPVLSTTKSANHAISNQKEGAKSGRKGSSRGSKRAASEAVESQSAASTFDVDTFAGIFRHLHIDGRHVSAEDLVSLFLRSVIPRVREDSKQSRSKQAKKKQKEEPTMSPFAMLYSTLIDVIRRCYGSRIGQHESCGGESATSSYRTGKKRFSSPSPHAAARKRRKIGSVVNAGEDGVSAKSSSTKAGIYPQSPRDGETLTSGINVIRASLAKEAIDALRACIGTKASNQEGSYSQHLRRLLREGMQTEHVIEIVSLAKTLDDLVIAPRTCTSMDASSDKHPIAKTTPIAPSPHGSSFTTFEKDLWLANLNLCVTLGRGNCSMNENSQLPQWRVLGDPQRRLKVFQTIAGGEKSNWWPLWLPTSIRAMVLSSMTASGDQREAESEGLNSPELLVAQGFVQSVDEYLKSWRSLLEDLFRPRRDLRDRLFVDYEIPLSRRDARLFLVAVGRLSNDGRNSILSSLLSSIKSQLAAVKENQARLNQLCEVKEISSFVGRVITVVSNLTLLVACPSLWERLISICEQAEQPEIPSFTSECDWYKSERCFMGLFSDWESSTIPPSVDGQQYLLGLSSNPTGHYAKQMTLILEMAFHIGFFSAKVDKCHLLFAAWNAMGNKPLWDPRRSTDSRSHSSAAKSVEEVASSINATKDADLDLPTLLLQIREEVCRMYGDVHKINGSSSTGHDLSVVLQSALNRERSVTASQVKKSMKAVFTNAEKLISSLLDRQGLPLGLFSVLEALSVYIAFGVASHTKPGNDSFTPLRRRKRPRGYSSESERDPSDVESVESDGGAGMDSDPRAKLQARLRDACNSFGAAPTHPDWLDASCRLLAGVSSNEALEVGQTAVRTLTKLLSVAYKRHKECLDFALRSLLKEPQNEPHDSRASLAAKLFVLLSRYESEECSTGDGERGNAHVAKEYIGAVCDIDLGALDVFFQSCASVEDAKSAWCPNSAQRIVGGLQSSAFFDTSFSSAELRVDGQWEILLGETLAGASRYSFSSLTNISNELNPEVSDSLINAEHWRGVCESAINSLMPAAALLRFGLARGGRQPHPLSWQENPENELRPYSNNEITERLPGSISASRQLREGVADTLATLARYSADCAGDAHIGTKCRAVSTHLLINSSSFSTLYGFEACRFGFTALAELCDVVPLLAGGGQGLEIMEALPFLVGRLIGVLEFWGQDMSNLSARPTVSPSPETDKNEFGRLLVLLGSGRKLTIDTVAENNVDPCGILSLLEKKDGVEGAHSQQANIWSWGQFQQQAVQSMISMLCSDILLTNNSSRARIARILKQTASVEYTALQRKEVSTVPFIAGLVTAFNTIDDRRLKALLVEDACGLSEAKSETRDASLREDLCLIFAFLAVPRGTSAFRKADFVVANLVESAGQWLNTPGSNGCILDLLFLYGCHSKERLVEVGSMLMTAAAPRKGAGIESAETADLEPLGRFLNFVRGLHTSLSKKSQSSRSTRDTRSSASSGKSASPSKAQAPPRSCSYALKSGFHGQHWYNCYTCNLTWDKGCCTLCALTCHRGHDVSYSRYSSFFCDCGAEDGAAADRNRVSCKCLTSLPKEDVDALFQKEGWIMPTPLPEAKSKALGSPADNLGGRGKLYADIAKTFFADAARLALEDLVNDARRQGWLESLFQVLRQEFGRWMESSAESKNPIEQNLDSYEPDGCYRYEYMRLKIRKRLGKALKLDPLLSEGLVSVKATKTNCFQGKLAGSTNERLKRTQRAAVIGDDRGRLVIAEQCSLLFCGVASSVMEKDRDHAKASDLSRGSLCIFGSSAVKFSVVGMQCCSDNSRHLVVWGFTEVCVTVLKRSFGAVERTITFSVDLDPTSCEADYVVKCAWIPGSQTLVAVACGRFVSIFDIERADGENRAFPFATFGLGFEGNLRDMELSPLMPSSRNGTGVQLDYAAALYVMLENGRLLTVDLDWDAEGKLSGAGEHQFEPSDYVLLPVTGSGSVASCLRSLGEGSNLTYLKQSGLVLYQCSTSVALALVPGSKGKMFSGGFELLPHTLSPDMLGTDPDGQSITGPYTHWTELGLCQDDKGERFFRVTCVGKSRGANQPKLLCVEFNEMHTKVRELSWEVSNSLGLGLCSSFEGAVAFSVPFALQSDNAEDSRSQFAERGFLGVLTDRGNLLLFGEDTRHLSLINRAVESRDGSPSSKKKDSTTVCRPDRSRMSTFPLTIFERLKNVGDSDEVVFGGDGLGSEKELNRKLSRDTSVFLMSPRREGCTLICSLNESSDPQKTAPASNLVIAAVRVLVGSTASDCIPRQIVIQGRPVELTRGLKKWYSLSLTDEEIALSARNGFVTVGISQAFEPSSNSLVDAVEVYAIEKQEIETWLPTVLSTKFCGNISQVETARAETHSLIVATDALASLCSLLGSKKKLSDDENSFFKQVIEETAFSRDLALTACVEKLLFKLYPDSPGRNSTHDECILMASSRILDLCEVKVGGSKNVSASGDLDNAWFSVRTLLRSILRTAAHIARCRPINYLRASQKINPPTSGKSPGSIAVKAFRLVNEGLIRSHLCEEDVVLDLVELSLSESAIDANTDSEAGLLAGFGIVRKLLESGNHSVMEIACKAINRFVEAAFHSSGEGTGLFAALQAARLVCYQCDGCQQFPIRSVRYTLLEEGYDIDLCETCFRVGQKYARSKGFGDSRVIINEKEMQFTCALVNTMQPVPIVKSDVKELTEIEPTGTQDTSTQFDDAVDENEELQRALRLSLGNAADEMPSSSSPVVDQALEDFSDGLFSCVDGVLKDVMQKTKGSQFELGLIVQLLVDLVQSSSQKSGKIKRAKKLSSEIAVGVSRLLNATEKNDKEGRLTLVICLRALIYLIAPEEDGPATSQRGTGANKPAKESGKSKQVACDVHGVAAVRRRCARGEHKDRRFYVCGLPRRERCKFFVWADQIGQRTGPQPKQRPKLDVDIAACLWRLFSGTPADICSDPLHISLCTFLERILIGWKSGASPSLPLTDAGTGRKPLLALPSIYREEDAIADKSDGVFCSRDKLRNVSPHDRLKITGGTKPPPALSLVGGDVDTGLVEVSLDLISLITPNHAAEEISKSPWSCLLCEIIGDHRSKAGLRSLAKKTLKQLTGGNRDLYHKIRDNLHFNFQIRSLLHNSENVLEYCLLLKEKARLSGPRWKQIGSKVDWTTLTVGGFLGVDSLISEDCSSLQSDRTTGEILDELWNVAKSRGENWRRFCGLSSLPHSYRESSAGETELLGRSEVLPPPPVVSLLWISCSLIGTNQIKALRLVDLSLSSWKDRKKATSNSNQSSSDDEEHAADGGPTRTTENLLSGESNSPEDIILNGAGKLCIGDVHAFLIQFGYKGRTSDLRKVACSIVAKLCRKLSSDDVGQLLEQLLGRPVDEAGQLGKNCVELLTFLQTQLRAAGKLPVRVTEAADVIMCYFTQQLQAMKHDRANGEWVYIEAYGASSNSKKRYELAPCIHCLRGNTPNASKDKASVFRGAQDRTSRSSSSAHRTSQGAASGDHNLPGSSSAQPSEQVAAKREWLPEQVSAFSPGRLDCGKESSTNNEFCLFRQLKYRLALHEVHVSIDDPRGRFVKTITVYFSPRPVSDVQVLKAEAYADKWQPCGTLNLTRGASRAVCTLPAPVVASNLKIEFTEFFERPGGSRAADGSFLVHCPRCTRVVNNAHGVCGNCGEVAWQCRKCRHINYDKLDSFLCVECGFCASGSFSFELVAGVCTNAVAITNDEDYERSMAMLSTATRLHEDLRFALKDKLRLLAQHRNRKVQKSVTDVEQSFLSPGLKRAFEGLDPLPIVGLGGSSDGRGAGPGSLLTNRVGKKGWAVKNIATPAKAHASSTDRIIRLARQLRTDNVSPDRRRSGDVIIRHLGRSSAVENIDDENDLINLLEGGGGLAISSSSGNPISGLDPSDPLSRLLASFQTSRRGRPATGQVEAGATASAIDRLTGAAGSNSRGRASLNAGTEATTRSATAGGNAGRKQSESAIIKERLEECDKLYVLLREAERECYELNRRVEDWKRLQRDELSDTGLGSSPSSSCSAPFVPSHCSVCSGVVAVQLLTVWLRLFQANPSKVSVTRQFVSLLLEEHGNYSKVLGDLKRAVLREIATTAPADGGGKLVLEELSARLRAARDVTSAEILGRIMEAGDDFSLADEYVDLALKVLESERRD